MIGLGVGIDYALLILTRHARRCRPARRPATRSSRRWPPPGDPSWWRAARSSISLAGLFLMRLPYLYGVALAAMIAVVVVVAAAVTLLPALLALMGHRVDRLRIPGREPRAADPHRAPAARWARAVQRRPLVAAWRPRDPAGLSRARQRPAARFPDAGNDREGTPPAGLRPACRRASARAPTGR
jgi:RND superfamily putative drug exporter